MNLSRVAHYFYPHKILDIGANVGQFFNLCQKYFPHSHVYCIEANENCEPYLKQLTNNYYIGLLAKDTSEYTFFLTTDNPLNTGNSIYRELTRHYTESKVLISSKKGVKLDDLFDSDEYFDLIKIDTQGSELDILEGGKSLCQKATGILLEVSLSRYNEGSPLYDDVLAYMEAIGYSCTDLLDETNIPGVVHQQDLLFIKK